jgi:hypothetical protein
VQYRSPLNNGRTKGKSSLASSQVLAKQPTAVYTLRKERNVWDEKIARFNQFTIDATDDRPMTFAVDNLPADLRFDQQTGHITAH